MKQSFVNINSFTSQKKKWKNCYFLFLFNETRENRQREVFKKSLVICNYASKLQQIIQKIQSQTEQHGTRTHTSIFCFCLTALSPPSIFIGARGQKFVQSAAASDIYGFFVFVSMEESGRRRTFLPRIGFIFSLKFFGFHTMFTHKKSFIPKNVKKENDKKETELYYSMPLCPL